MKTKLTALLMAILFYSFCYYALLQATEDVEFSGQWGSYSDGVLVDTFGSHEACLYISDGMGECNPIIEE